MEIYKPSVGEWEKLKKIRLEAIEKEPKAFFGKLQIECNLPEEIWKIWIEQSQKNVLLFAKERNDVIGMIGMKEVGGNAHVWGVYVLSEYRKKGIGKLLFGSILEEIKLRKYQKIKLTVHTCQTEAISLYKSFGFSIMETIAFGNDQKYLMGKQINI